MEEWKNDILINLLEVLIDYRGKTPKKTASGIPLVTAKIIKGGTLLPYEEYIANEDYDTWMVRGLPMPGDVVMTTEAPLGEVALLGNDKVALAQRVVTLRGKKGVLDNTFLKYFLQSDIGQKRLTARETGTTVTGIKQSELRKVEITYPDYCTQCGIGSILKSLDDKIALNNRINHNLEKQAQALYKSWFVDFEPFRHGKFVDSELGMIPEGWSVSEIGNYCKIKSGFAFKSSWWQNEGIKVVKIKNINSDGRLDLTDCSFVSQSHADLAKDFITKRGDLLIAMTGATIGKYCIVNSDESYCVNQRVGKFFLGSNPIDKLPFIYCSLCNGNVINEIINRGQGSAQPNISGKDIETICIVYPSPILIDKFNEKAKAIFENIISNEIENSRLASLRDSLLPILMSGELVFYDYPC